MHGMILDMIGRWDIVMWTPLTERAWHGNGMGWGMGCLRDPGASEVG